MYSSLHSDFETIQVQFPLVMIEIGRQHDLRRIVPRLNREIGSRVERLYVIFRLFNRRIRIHVRSYGRDTFVFDFLRDFFVIVKSVRHYLYLFNHFHLNASIELQKIHTHTINIEQFSYIFHCVK